MLAITPLRSSLRPGTRAKQRLLIVGNGMAGHRLCRLLSGSEACKARYEVTILGEERVPAYDRIRLSESLERAGEPVLLDSADWYQQHGFDLRLGEPAERIDRKQRIVHGRDGSQYPYDRLVLATGARALIPPLPGSDHDRVFVYRTIEDTRRITDAARGAKVGAVVGGGLLGLEAAHVLRELGLFVHVVEHGSSLMPRQLDSDSGMVLDRLVRDKGVDTHLGCRLAGIEPTAGGLRLAFDNSEPLDVDLVVMAIGIRPRDELAKEAGLRLAVRGGVIVNDSLRTSDPRIFAIGECAVHRGTHYGLVAPGYEMAEVVAARLGGERRRFRKADVSCQLKLLEVPVAAVGSYDQEARLVSFSFAGPEGRRSIMLDGRRLIGATTVGSWPQIVRVQDAAKRELRLSARQLRLFESTGELWQGSDDSGVAEWPEHTVVCNCTGVTRGALTRCMTDGLVTVDALTQKTRAGSVCGSCKPLLGELVGQPTNADAGGKLPLIAASILTAAIAVILLTIPSLHTVQSTRDEARPLSLLLRDSLFKQTTGFAVLGLVAMGMLLSARKRLSFFKHASVFTYRCVHGALGALALGLVGIHSGMRLGHHANFALMAVFLTASLLGAIAGVATAMESGTPGPWSLRARKLRSPLSLVHILVLWPLPVLLGWHIFAAYYF